MSVVLVRKGLASFQSSAHDATALPSWGLCMTKRTLLVIIGIQFAIILYLGYSVLDLATWNDDLKQEVARLHEGK